MRIFIKPIVIDFYLTRENKTFYDGFSSHKRQKPFVMDFHLTNCRKTLYDRFSSHNRRIWDSKMGLMIPRSKAERSWSLPGYCPESGLRRNWSHPGPNREGLISPRLNHPKRLEMGLINPRPTESLRELIISWLKIFFKTCSRINMVKRRS